MENETLPTSVDHLIGQIEADYTELEDLLSDLEEEQIISMPLNDGWTVKDHLVHITAWERSVLAFLNGESRRKALGVDDQAAKAAGDDYHRLNQLIYEANKNRSLADVLADFRAVHTRLLLEVKRLQDSDLQRDYASFYPERTDLSGGPRAVEIIMGSTAEHYQEHIGWIREAMLG